MFGDYHFVIMREAIQFLCRRETLRYIFVSISSYLLMLALMILFVDVVCLKSAYSFLVSYAILYIYDYISSLRYVFNKRHNTFKILLYICYLVVFYVIGNMTYIVLNKLDINYLIQTFLAMILTFPLKYLSLKHIVFR